jgi:hypothetical protein
MDFEEAKELLDEMLKVFRENSKYERAVDLAKRCIDYAEFSGKILKNYK